MFAADAQRPAGRYEPIQADEVAAFKSALAAGGAGIAVAGVAGKGVATTAATAATAGIAATTASPDRAGALDASTRHGPQSYTLLTGYEDTEIPGADMRTPVLSGTQYGELN
jgi:hypothetical protein